MENMKEIKSVRAVEMNGPRAIGESGSVNNYPMRWEVLTAVEKVKASPFLRRTGDGAGRSDAQGRHSGSAAVGCLW